MQKRYLYDPRSDLRGTATLEKLVAALFSLPEVLQVSVSPDERTLILTLPDALCDPEAPVKAAEGAGFLLLPESPPAEAYLRAREKKRALRPAQNAGVLFLCACAALFSLAGTPLLPAGVCWALAFLLFLPQTRVSYAARFRLRPVSETLLPCASLLCGIYGWYEALAFPFSPPKSLFAVAALLLAEAAGVRACAALFSLKSREKPGFPEVRARAQAAALTTLFTGALAVVLFVSRDLRTAMRFAAEAAALLVQPGLALCELSPFLFPEAGKSALARARTASFLLPAAAFLLFCPAGNAFFVPAFPIARALSLAIWLPAALSRRRFQKTETKGTDDERSSSLRPL